jgi:hypothetical protein
MLNLEQVADLGYQLRVRPVNKYMCLQNKNIIVFAGLFIDKAASLIRFPPRLSELWKGNPHLEALGP